MGMRWNLRVSRLLWVALNLLAFAAIYACDFNLFPLESGLNGWEDVVDVHANAVYTLQWSPHGDHIVFVGVTPPRRYIYVVASDGSRLWTASDTGGDKFDYSPDISPDGSRIVYVTTYNENLDIETSRLDGSDRLKLTDNEEWNISPAWSPDGSRIAFVKADTRGDHERGIYTMASDGSDLRRPLSFSSGYPLNFSSGYEWPNERSAIRWSPDGKMLAFVLEELKTIRVENEPSDESSRRGIGYRADNEGRLWAIWQIEVLYTMAADGSGRTPLLEMAWKDGDLIIGSPEWSPDGGSIAFMTYSDEHFRVNTIGPDGSGMREVAKLHSPSYGNRYNSLSWSPDGTRILFSSLGINVVNEDGSGLRRVADGQYASWSPDGSQIVVTSGYGSDPEDFFLATMAPDGSDRLVLVTRDEDGNLKAVYEKPGSPWTALWIAGGVVLAIVGLFILRKVLRRRGRSRAGELVH